MEVINSQPHRYPALYVGSTEGRQAKALTQCYALPMIASSCRTEGQDLPKKGVVVMSEALFRTTQRITASDLPRMVLNQRDLPSALRDFLLVRAGPLDKIGRASCRERVYVLV